MFHIFNLTKGNDAKNKRKRVNLRSMYLVVLYIFIRWKGRVTIIVTITFLRKYAKSADRIENITFPRTNIRGR